MQGKKIHDSLGFLILDGVYVYVLRYYILLFVHEHLFVNRGGRFIKAFEEKFAEFCNVKHAITCSNGTIALHLALKAAGIKEGDEVILPTFTIISCANAIIWCGAKPVLVDADPRTWNINPEKIEEKITEKTKAIMPVHMYGHPCDMDKIQEIANKHNLLIIEDAAEAHGATYKGKKTGSMSDIAIFSFYANKIITTGEGGMVVTNNDKFAERARLLKNLAFQNPRFLHDEIGFNYRLTNMQAALGLAQTENADKLVNMRIKNANLYTQLLKEVKGLQLPPETDNIKNVFWMYGLVLNKDFGCSRDELLRKLKEKGVGTRTFFIPMHQQPVFKSNHIKNSPDCNGDFPVADNLGKNGFYLPSTSNLSEEQIHTITNTIKEIQKEVQQEQMQKETK